jgi:hypothetical protein
MYCSGSPRRRAAGALVALLAALTLAAPARADGDVDPALASKIILKLLLLDEDLEEKTGNQVVIGVLGSEAAYEAFAALQGKSIDQNRSVVVSEVVRYGEIPAESERPTVLFVGEAANPEAAIAFTRASKVLSATNVSGFVEKGVTVGIIVEDNRPKVLLNLVGSEQEGIHWNPKILKFARTVR